jgi:hypothetical protein
MRGSHHGRACEVTLHTSIQVRMQRRAKDTGKDAANRQGPVAGRAKDTGKDAANRQGPVAGRAKDTERRRNGAGGGPGSVEWELERSVCFLQPEQANVVDPHEGTQEGIAGTNDEG